jgi:NodT family efflux transporter outer membrane factor (OMF) lipoprotein
VRAQLAALLGAGPDRGAAIERPQLKLARPAAVPAMLPSVLLARRPDVVAQRWRVESLGRDIDAAKAQFYPSINLNGLIGLQSLGFSHLLQGGSMIAGAGAGLSLPIFDGGRLRGNLALRNADYDVAVEAYNQTLIEALRDVVSQLVSIEWLAERGTLQAQALETAQQAYDLSLRRYRSGVGNYLQVLASQIQVLQQQRAQIDLDTRAFDLDMQLARALGGGYSTPSSR